MRKRLMLAGIASHAIVAAIGFAAGIYALPILVAPPGPDEASLAEAAKTRRFVGTFSRDREGSDALHWGDGEISIGSEAVTFRGKLAPGPDYKLYLSPEFVETSEDFLRLKSAMVRVGDVKTFENFHVPLQSEIDPSEFTTVIVWCESFEQFITSASYREGPG